jgi:hypothetical protein
MTTIYKCTICNYITKDTSNLKRHNKTKKHLTNTSTKTTVAPENFAKLVNTQQTTSELPVNYKNAINIIEKSKYVCEYCGKCITRYNNVNKHLNSCIEKKKKEFDSDHKFELLNLKLDQYEKNVTHQTKETQHYKDEAEYYKQLLMEAGGLVKKSVSALTYSVTNYNDAPPIKTIEVAKIKTFKDSNKKIAEDILSAYKHKTLNQYLGDIIIIIYKKDNPLDQSIWNTDDVRFTYIIKELLNNKSSNWIVDKKGIKTGQYLINPLLEYIKKSITSYQKEYDMSTLDNMDVLNMFIENSKKIMEVINGIDDGVIAKDVLKYISSHLRFNDKNLTIK